MIVASVPRDARHAPRSADAIGEQLIDALVEIHAVDWRAAGLEDFGKPTGYLERQLRRFIGLWELNKTREIPAVESVGAWLAENLPESGPATIVHGDYRLGNTIFAARAARAPGGGARLGDGHDRRPARGPRLPVHDVDARPATPRAACASTSARSPARRASPRRAELIARYEERSGRSMRDMRWYTTLALWKSVVFMEGNYKRAIAGTTDDPYLKQFGEGVLELARQAEEVARGACSLSASARARC